MAGIGFELKKLFKKKGIIAKLRAYGYTGMITSGPTLIGIFFLLGITYLGKSYGLDADSQDLLVSMITYVLLFSLMITSLFTMIATRFTADMLYEECDELVLSSLEGVLALCLPLGGLIFGIFIINAGISRIQMVLNFILFMELLVVWIEMSYLTAIKDYKGLLLSYVISVLVSLIISYLGVAIFGASLEFLLLAVVIGYGIMMVMDTSLLYRFFPLESHEPFLWLKWIDKYFELVIIGFFTNFGLFCHLVIAWFSPIGVHIQGAYYGCPQHDVPALFAFLTTLITSINFVASVEVNFYPKYRYYYDLFNGTGSITEIDRAQDEMLEVLDHELAYVGRRQLILSIAIGTAILDVLPLGFNSLMNGYFRILCIGYGVYSVGNVLMLMLMYYADYDGAAKASLLFGASSFVFSVVSILYPSQFYGFGFALASCVYFIVVWYKIYDYTKNLPYTILSIQPLIAENKKGFFTRLANFLNKLCGGDNYYEQQE